jgi:protein-disulfide isomerase
LLISIAVLVSACGGSSSGLSASSSCKDFGSVSPEEQVEVISKLATEYRTPELTTPLGEPDVAYACASEPEMTLETFFKGFHENEASGQTAAAGGETGSSLDGVSEVDELVGELPQEGLTIGEPDAPVTLVEFGDLQSPIEKTTAEEISTPLIGGQVADGEAKLEFRNFVVIGQDSIKAAIAALAAGRQGRGWSFVELFFRNQGEENTHYITPSFLKEIAEGAGVEDIAAWEEELGNPELEGEVEEQTEEADHIGFEGVPSFAVEGPATEGLELLGTPGSVAPLEKAITAAGR